MTVVAVVQHENDCPLGWFDGWLRDAGATVRIHRPYAGEPLPTIAGADALVVLGGSMSANDDDKVAWLGATKVLLRDAVAAGLPTLGICLGHQLLAAACGGRVERNPAGKQMGLFPLGLTSLGRCERAFATVADRSRCVQWNDDIVVEAPDSAEVLATVDGVPQVLRLGSALGVQFHPEAGADIVAAWAASGPTRPGANGAIAAIRAAEPELVVTWASFARAWLPG
jgi:GMP synthase (glutamine-hydrolysing)